MKGSDGWRNMADHTVARRSAQRDSLHCPTFRQAIASFSRNVGAILVVWVRVRTTIDLFKNPFLTGGGGLEQSMAVRFGGLACWGLKPGFGTVFSDIVPTRIIFVPQNGPYTGLVYLR